jgi:hypothetical protein
MGRDGETSMNEWEKDEARTGIGCSTRSEETSL